MADYAQGPSMPNVDGEDANAVRVPSALSDLALFETLQQWFYGNRDHSQEWRKDAKEWFRFVSGEQWNEKDRAYLDSQNRPVITFNRTLPMLKSVAGIEVNSRMEATFLPRVTEDEQQISANEVLSAANQWMGDNCDAEDEQSEAFWDTLVCGMGWTEGRLDYDEDPDALYVEDKVNPLEMYWDRNARKKNLTDRQNQFRLRKMTLNEARNFVEGLGIANIPDEELDAQWATESDANSEKPRPIEERRKREENAAQFDPKAMVHLVQAQWIEYEQYFRALDPATGQLVSLEAEQHAALKKTMGGMLRSVPMRRKVYKQAILGGSLLGTVKPTLSRSGFTINCITGDKNTDKGTFFGIVKTLRDPQQWANKWLSQSMHILNTTAKGGILAEEDAFDDIREAQITYARPDAVTMVKPGAIQKGKIMAKPGAGIPTGYQGLLEFAISSIRDTTGINLELLGASVGDQPGIVVAQRKQAAMTILATTFDSFRRFRKINARMRLCFIQDYFSDGRLVRIKGKDGVQRGIRLIRDKTAGEYEVVVADAPTSTTQKEQIWALFEQLMPILQPFMNGRPDVALAVLEYSGLPSQVIETLRGLANQPTPPLQAQEHQLGVAKQTAEIKLLGARALHAEAQAAHAAADADETHSSAAINILRSAGALGGGANAVPNAVPNGPRQPQQAGGLPQ